MKFDWKNWNWGGKVIFVAACVSIVSMFMNWVDIGIASQSGLTQGAFLLLGLWVYPGLMLFKNRPIKRGWGLSCSILSVVFTIIYINSKSIALFGKTVNAAGSGAWLFLLASIALIVGVVRYGSMKSIDKAEQTVPADTLGDTAKNAINNSHGMSIGKGIAIAGLILGFMAVILILIGFLLPKMKSLEKQPGALGSSVQKDERVNPFDVATKDDTQVTKPKDITSDHKIITTDELMTIFGDESKLNDIKQKEAAKSYEGKPVSITGRVYDVVVSEKAKIYIDVKSVKYALSSVRILMKDSEKEKATALNKDDTVSISGTIWQCKPEFAFLIENDIPPSVFSRVICKDGVIIGDK